MSTVLDMVKISETLNKSKAHMSIFLDFSRAFDRVDHYFLIRRLDFWEVHGWIFDWLRSCLSNWDVFVCIQSCKSEHCKITRCVPQGYIQGPFLSIIYTFYLDKCINTNVFLYGKNIVLLIWLVIPSRK